MTAGRGIMHSEMPLTKSRGLQLWVNLKSKDKMVEPSYQELEASQIPTATQNGVTVKGIFISPNLVFIFHLFYIL